MVTYHSELTPMKILHILPSIRSGGVATLVLDLVSFQVAHNNQVDVFVTRPGLNHMQPVFENIGATVDYSHYLNRNDPRHIWELKSKIKDYDIVHVHLFPDQLFVSIAKMLIKKKHRPILITTEHSTFNNRRKYKLFKVIDRWMYNQYNSIIAISDAAKSALDNWLHSQNLSTKTHTIVNGVDIAKFEQAQNKLKSVLSLPIGVKLVVMVARLAHPKDPLTLVKAISECPTNVNLAFIGYGPLEKEITQLAKNLNISERVHLLGLRNNVSELLKGCDIGVLSTNWDGFGLVAVEYMAAGMPVIASDVEGLRDVIGRKDALFAVGDYHQLANKINSLISSETLYNEQRNFFKNRANLFDVKLMCQKYTNHYLSLTHNIHG